MSAPTPTDLRKPGGTHRYTPFHLRMGGVEVRKRGQRRLFWVCEAFCFGKWRGGSDGDGGGGGAEQRVAVLVHVQRVRVGLLLGYYGGGAVIIDDRENKISVFFVSY